MSVVLPSNVLELLTDLHGRLDLQFRALHERRQLLEPISPVFALEHNLFDSELDTLKTAVRAGIRDYSLSHFSECWLPFVVYAAEMGYGYEGDEYWTTFSSETPRWTNKERGTIRDWFERFASEFGGARPSGAWARHFTIVAWPITHAVLPVYLQRQFAKLLFEFRTGLTPDLLGDPDALGIRLTSLASRYSDRFRQFAQNSALIGQVAAALLAGGEDESPYLTKSTLDRIVAGLSHERQVRQWLTSARQEATRVRGIGFRHESSRSGTRGSQQRQHRATDPKFFLRLTEAGWNALAELSDLTPISERAPEVYEEMRTLRAHVVGASRVIASGGLTDPGVEVRFQTWPDPEKPFVQLENGSERANDLIAAECVMTPGPWWLYRRRGVGLAVEVKGRFVRPGLEYILVGKDDRPAPNLSWCSSIDINVEGTKAYRLDVPEQLSESETAALVSSGLSSLSSVEIRPVGIVARSWDGEGVAECLSGEPVIVGIRSELRPGTCRITLDGDVYGPIPWPEGELEMVLSLADLVAGEHELRVSLLGDAAQELTAGVMAIVVDDPLVRPEGATPGEGLRMLASPARPSLTELWDEKASVTIDGPDGAEVSLTVSLLDDRGVQKIKVIRKVRLPVDGGNWRKLVRSIRGDHKFENAYDDAESSVMTVLLGTVGMASLTCERGFQPLRWRFTSERDGKKTAWLSDRSDRDSTQVEFWAAEKPLEALPRDPTMPISLPSRGGLLRATSGDSEAIVLAPTNPNDLIGLGSIIPEIQLGNKSVAEVMNLVFGHLRWRTADLPADPFALLQRQIAMDAFARAIAVLLGGSHWSAVEWKIAHDSASEKLLQIMREMVGNTSSHEALAAAIYSNLHRWRTSGELSDAFLQVIHQTLVENGVEFSQHPSADRFVLALAGCPTLIMDWPESEREYLLSHVMTSPVVLRAARFATLGARILYDIDFFEGSF